MRPLYETCQPRLDSRWLELHLLHGAHPTSSRGGPPDMQIDEPGLVDSEAYLDGKHL